MCRSCGERIVDPFLLLIAQRQQRVLVELRQLRDRLDAVDGQTTEPDPQPDTGLLSPAELARRLGRSRDWIYANAELLGAIRVGNGERPRLYFDFALARERLAARSAKANGRREPSETKPRRRPRRQSGGVELLPVKGRAAA